MDFKKDYYKILEVNRTASKGDIKASYRRLTKTYHPDKNPGDHSVEEKIKLLNEAHEVLNNDITRHVYDEYKKQAERLQQENEKSTNVNIRNKKTYYRTETIRKEKRVYIRGTVIVKFWGEQLEQGSIHQAVEINYTIHPTDVRVNIDESNIHPLDKIPSHYQKSFKESELFKTPLQQPIKCTVKSSAGEEHYSLNLYDIRIKNPKISNVTKHDEQSLGTLKGELYAYALEIENEEIPVLVTECFGPTGKEETKQEDGATYVRKEYYYKNCSTYWSPWEKIITPKPPGKSPIKIPSNGCLDGATGCLQWWWIPLLLLFIIAFPPFILGLLVISAIALLFNLLAGLFSIFPRLLSWLAFLFLILILIAAIRSCSSGRTPYIKHDTPRYDTLSTSTVPVQVIPRGDTSSVNDTLINHFIRWKDYNSALYEANLAISASDFRSSSFAHDQFDEPNLSGLAPVYSYLGRNDDSKLFRVYNTFDSIKQQRGLDEVSFAKIIVSCIQSVPFYLVVDRSCSDPYYDDDYIQNYLASCAGDCCIGYEKYGVRSPVEFLSDLKGDCDTRSLLLYTILKHYNYNVALLTSKYYKHALIAVNFKSFDTGEGVAMNIHNHNYYLWETTGAGFNVGIIPTYLQDLGYWEIALLNEN